MALLGIAGSAVGIFFIPAVGRWIDRFGTAQIMIIEAAAFFFVYIAYGILSAGLSAGVIATVGLPVFIAFAIKMADGMTTQFGMVRSVYMRTVALFPGEITPTLTLGMAMDHVVSICGAVFCGWIWQTLGPLYVFVFAALLAVCNMVVALSIRKQQNADLAETR
jgi:predicted MFS family arabinose efflux permease